MKNILYLLVVLTIVCGAIGTLWPSYRLGCSHNFFYDDLHPFNVLQEIAVFVFFKGRLKSFSPKWRPVVIKLFNYSIGIYLVHPLLMYVCINYLGLSSSTIPSVWFVPVYIVLIYSFLFSEVSLHDSLHEKVYDRIIYN